MSGAGRSGRAGTVPGTASVGWPATVQVGELVERLPAALLLVALAGSDGSEPVVTGSNAAARQLLGRARLELHGIPLRTLLAGGGRAGSRSAAQGSDATQPGHDTGCVAAPPDTETGCAATSPDTDPGRPTSQAGCHTEHPATPPDADSGSATPVSHGTDEPSGDLVRQVRAWRAAGELLPGQLSLTRPDGTAVAVDGCALPPAPGRLPLLLLHLRRAEDGALDRVGVLERRAAELGSQVQRRLVAEQRLRELLARASDEVDAARASEEQFRLAFENAPVGAAIVGLDGRIHRANGALAILLARGVDELTTMYLVDLTHPEDVDADASQLVELVAGRSLGYRVGKRLLRPDDSEVRVAATVSLARAADGSPDQLVVQVEDVEAEHAAEAALERLALHDALTGLPNRLLLRDRVRQGLHRLDRGSSGCGLLVVDLDKFKFVNDAYGHDIGDALLVEIAQRIAGTLRSSDTAARLGGDEFVVLCEDVPDLAAVAVAAERFERAVVRPARIGGLTLSITASVGITHTTDPAADPDELLRQGDLAKHRAKESGRARAEPFDAGLATETRERTTLERDLRRSIDPGELVIHYQPIIDLQTSGLVRVEALVRWQHPTRGLLHPKAFIELAEQTGLVVPLGEQVLRQACGRRRRDPHRVGPEPAAAPARDHGERARPDQPRPLPRARSPQGAGGGAGTRRLRHGLLLARLPQGVPGRRHQDRSGFRRGGGLVAGGRGHRPLGRRARPGARTGLRRRGHRDP